MSDKSDRDPFNERYGESSESEKTADESEMSQASKDSKTTVRERKNVNMYLPEELVDDLQLRYKRLDIEWREEHGEDLPKNAEFYPAVVRAALNETSIEEELGVE